MRLEGLERPVRDAAAQKRGARVTCTPGRTGRSSRTDARARGSRARRRVPTRTRERFVFRIRLQRETRGPAPPRGASAGGVAGAAWAVRSVRLTHIRIMHESIRPASPTPPPRGGGSAARVRRRRALAEVQRAVERLGETPQKRSRAVGAARQVVVVRDVQVREQAVDVQARLLAAGSLAEDAEHGDLRGAGTARTTSARG